jgi:hypothetical protein
MHNVKIKTKKWEINPNNTSQRIFSEYVLKDGSFKTLERKPSKHVYPCSVDNLLELITYKHAPEFRSEVNKFKLF